MYNFDEIIDRHNSGSLKFDALGERYGRNDLIPLWVADMDFRAADFITDALNERMKHPIFGYNYDSRDFFPSIIDWVRSHHDYEIDPHGLCYVPGVVRGIGFAINALTNRGDKIIIQTPVYHPFRFVVEGLERELVLNPLREANGTYEMDFEHLERIADDCKMLILCNPHNPAGVVWSKETLQRLASICKKKGIIVVSDEIHCDLTLFGNKHHVFTSVSADAAEIGIVLSAPSKTFNLAGIVASYLHVRNETLRAPLFKWMESGEFNEPNMFAPIVTIASFRKGEEYRRELVSYIEGNVSYVCDFIKREIPSIKAWRPQASFLVWLDCRELGLSQPDLVRLFEEKAGLALNDGSMFGAEGRGFMRLNVGCPRATLEKAMERLSQAVSSR